MYRLNQSNKPFFRKISFEHILVCCFLLYIFFFTIVPIFGKHFDRIPGDLIDARFNNYLLENGYSYLTQKDHIFWNAPFCYPEKNIISFSDNFIGQLPVYTLFRIGGLDNQSAYQGWMVVTFLLNFCICAWVLYKLSGSRIGALVGAFIFSFALPLFDQNYHSQMLARYAIPLAFYHLIRFLKNGRHLNFLYLLLSVVLQFYLSIYLGLLLSLALFCGLTGYLIFYRRDVRFSELFAKRKLRWLALHALLAGALLFVFMRPYVERSKQPIVPMKETVMASLPEPSAYLLTSWNATSWRDLTHVPDGMKDFWNKFLFPGGVAAAAVLAFLVMLIINGYRLILRMPESGLKLGMVFLAGFLLIFILTTRFHEFTVYQLVYRIPGFKAMRDLCRVVNVELFFYAGMAALLVSLLLARIRNPWLRNMFATLLLIGVVVDNLYDPVNAVTYSKEGSRKQFMELVAKIKAHPDYRSYEAMVYMPAESKDYAGAVQIDAMLAAQYLKIKTVNAYTATCPAHFCEFAVHSNVENLKIWLNSKGLAVDSTRFLFIR
ncbi:MAG: hypothetical protein ACHQRM_08590 [Bacteroidia bacterium]